MNKNYILIVGAVVSLVAVLFLVIDNDLDIKNIDTKKSQTELKEEHKDYNIDIDYKSSESNNKSVESSQQNLEKKKREREPFLEANTYDKSKKFEIALINPNQDLSKKWKGHTTLQGQIDGMPFFLDVPKSLIEEGSGNTELRIKNLETGDVTSVTAAFIDDMRNPKNKQKISIDSSDVENYRQEQVEQIVPLRPGELRE